jgi:uncharacterized protein YhaN
LQQHGYEIASQVSHGTKEQIYLLLRMAMARHLTQPKEICPLLLDDVTVQSDAERTKGILSLLKAVSQERSNPFQPGGRRAGLG